MANNDDPIPGPAHPIPMLTPGVISADPKKSEDEVVAADAMQHTNTGARPWSELPPSKYRQDAGMPFVLSPPTKRK